MELKYYDRAINKNMSRIVFGTAFGPFMMGKDANHILDDMYDLGINTIDTARKYMGSEKSIGKWLKERNNREKVVIISKCAHPDIFGRKRVTEKAIRHDLAKSLKYLQTDYIDIYLLHRDNPDVPVSEIVNIMNNLIKEGKIRAYGGSNFAYKRLNEAITYANKNNLVPPSFSSPHYSLGEQIGITWDDTCESITGKKHKEDIEWYKNNQMPVIAYSSLCRGLFSGKIHTDTLDNVNEAMDEPGRKGYGYEANFERLRRAETLAKEKNTTVASIALAYIFSSKMNMFAIVSTSKKERMKENINSLNIVLSDDEMKYLNPED